MQKDNTTSIVWFRRDLRLEDHMALATAVSRGAPVIPVFIASPDDALATGAASRWWLERSLRSLATSLEAEDSRLIVRQGEAAQTLLQLVAETGATAVFMNRRYEPEVQRRDERLIASFNARGVDAHIFNDSLLFDPVEVRTGTGGPYRVFTPFWKRLLVMEDPGARIPKPKRIIAPATWPQSQDIDGLDLVVRQEKTAQLVRYWRPGEKGALETFERFLQEGIHSYGDRHDQPGVDGTSRLSPHLHFGEISVRRMWHDIRASHTNGADPHDDPYLRQLAWREFSYYLLHYYPESVGAPLRKSFENFPWRDDRQSLDAWKRGQTGYPLVDAGMRELAETGWMHNRVRMVAASFLVKHLMVHWLEGAKWFMEKLVDADVANNTMGWQWTAGCGADAAPYFRVFNPVLQGIRFDRHGDYVRKWLPELRRLPDRYIHTPWTAPENILAEAGIEIGRGYPAPLVRHDDARARALKAYRSLGGTSQSSFAMGENTS